MMSSHIRLANNSGKPLSHRIIKSLIALLVMGTVALRCISEESVSLEHYYDSLLSKITFCCSGKKVL